MLIRVGYENETARMTTDSVRRLNLMRQDDFEPLGTT